MFHGGGHSDYVHWVASYRHQHLGDVRKAGVTRTRLLMRPVTTVIATCHGRVRGTYTLMVGSLTIPRLHCDGAGYALIQNSNGTCVKYTSLSVGVRPDFCGYLPESVVRQLAMLSSDVRLTDRNATADSVTTFAVEALRRGSSWDSGATWNGVTFNGTWDWTYSGDDTNATMWPDMYQAAGNPDGVQWMASQRHMRNARGGPIATSSTSLLMLPTGRTAPPATAAPSTRLGQPTTAQPTRRPSTGQPTTGVPSTARPSTAKPTKPTTAQPLPTALPALTGTPATRTPRQT